MTRREIALRRKKKESDLRIKAIQRKVQRMMDKLHAKGFCSDELLKSLNTVYY